MERLAIELPVLQHLVQEAGAGRLAVEVVRPQREHVGGADVDARIDEVGADVEFRGGGQEVRVDRDARARGGRKSVGDGGGGRAAGCGKSGRRVGGALLVVETAVGGRVENEGGRASLRLGAVGRSRAAEDHGHDGVFVSGPAGPMGCECGLEVEVGDDVAVDDDEVVGEDGALVEVAHGVSDGG